MRKHPLIMGQILPPFSNSEGDRGHSEASLRKIRRKGPPTDSRGGESIHIGSRMPALADAYDAMTSVRPYRDAPGIEDVTVGIR
jgi:hypothetical protein